MICINVNRERAEGVRLKSYGGCTEGEGPAIKADIAYTEGFRFGNQAHEALSAGPEIKSYISCSEGLRPFLNRTSHTPRGSGSGIMLMKRSAQVLKSNRTSHAPRGAGLQSNRTPHPPRGPRSVKFLILPYVSVLNFTLTTIPTRCSDFFYILI